MLGTHVGTAKMIKVKLVERRHTKVLLPEGTQVELLLAAHTPRHAQRWRCPVVVTTVPRVCGEGTSSSVVARPIEVCRKQQACHEREPWRLVFSLQGLKQRAPKRLPAIGKVAGKSIHEPISGRGELPVLCQLVAHHRRKIVLTLHIMRAHDAARRPPDAVTALRPTELVGRAQMPVACQACII